MLLPDYYYCFENSAELYFKNIEADTDNNDFYSGRKFVFHKRNITCQIWIINITYEGIDSTVRMILTLSLLMVGASILTLTTTPILLTDGIEKLMTPLSKIGVPAHEIAMMMTIALRFIPTLLEETQKIIKAQSSRGADFDSGNIFKRAKSFVPILVPLFISAFRRADELANAMESRCYRGSEGRTRMKQLKLGMIDLWISLTFTVFVAGLVILQNMQLF